MKKVLIIIFLASFSLSAGSSNHTAKPETKPNALNDALTEQTAKIDNLSLRLKNIK